MRIASLTELQERAERIRERRALLAAEATRTLLPLVKGDTAGAASTDADAVLAMQTADDDGWPTHLSQR